MPYVKKTIIGPHVVSFYQCDFGPCEVEVENSDVRPWVVIELHRPDAPPTLWLQFCTRSHVALYFADDAE